MKCVKPEMLYHFVQASFGQFGAQQNLIENALDEVQDPLGSGSQLLTECGGGKASNHHH